MLWLSAVIVLSIFKSCIFIIRVILIIGMSFDFDFFDQEPRANDNNLEEVMKKIEDESFGFDQFDPVDDNPNQKSFNSSFFKEQPKKEEKLISAKSRGKSESADFQNSRNLSQISYLGDERNQSFRYEQPPPSSNSDYKKNPRYQKLQMMMAQAKKTDLNMFYKNLEQQNAYKVQQKFNSKEEFNYYRNQLKAYKRQKQETFKQAHGPYHFKNNHYKMPQTSNNNQIQNVVVKAAFKKKEAISLNKVDSQPRGFGMNKNNLLPSEFVQEDQGFDFFEIGEEDIKKQVKDYEEKQYQKEAQRFFDSEEQQNKQKKTRNTHKLEPIREERPNLFQVSHQSQKMAKIINKYDDMKKNFFELMVNLKQTNADQQMIIKEMKNIKQQLKQQYVNKESRLKIQAQTKKQKKVMKERQRQQKERIIAQLRQKVSKEGNDKDLLFLKINEKLQTMEQIIRNGINQMNQEKEQKFIPKIINYYAQQSPHSSRQKSEGGFSKEDNQMANQNYQSQIRKLQEQELLAPVRNAIKELKQERRQQPILCNLDQFCSPLQLDLTTNDFPLNLSRNRSQQLEQTFVPPEGAKQYLPATLDATNKYLRKCLTQKSSVIFQSFEFYVTGKFTMTGNDRYPVLCQVRVANKCAVNLYDVFVVVFGPQAQQSQLQMRPNKIMHDEFRNSTSFLFEVDLSKSCLENGGFSIMISYKTDSVNKKKVVFKVVLPFVQLIKPEFIYEQQFTSGWNHMGNETYIMPKTLDFKNIRSHEDLKLIMPFIEIGEIDPNAFSYGIMFRYPTSQTIFMMKITCYINGKASIHLKSSETNGSDKKLKEEILDIMNYLCFG